jgi:hypothetical protein
MSPNQTEKDGSRCPANKTHSWLGRGKGRKAHGLNEAVFVVIESHQNPTLSASGFLMRNISICLKLFIDKLKKASAYALISSDVLLINLL